MPVFTSEQMHFQQVQTGHGRKVDHAVIGVSLPLTEPLHHLGGQSLQRLCPPDHPIRLPVMAGMIYRFIQSLGPAQGVDINILREHLADLLLKPGRSLGECFPGPLPGIFPIAVLIPVTPFVIVVCQCQEITQRHLMELQIPYIDDPCVPDAIFISHAHLLPGLGHGSGIHPFIGDGASMIVKMVIHAPAAFAIPHFRGGQGAHLAEIVLAEHADHTLQFIPVLQTLHLLIPVKICLHLFVQGQKLGHFFPLHIIGNQRPLLADNIFQQVHILFHGGLLSQHGSIPLSPHPDGDQILIFAAALQSFLPVV